MRETKSIVSHLVDKLQKLAVSDEDELKKVQKHISKDMNSYEDSIKKYNEQLSVINYKIEKYESPLLIKEAIDTTSKELNRINKIISKHSENI